MPDYFRECVNRYQKVKGAPVLRPSRTAGLPSTPAQLADEKLTSPGGLFRDQASSLVMSVMYGARMCAPHLLTPVCELAGWLSRWCPLADLKLVKLFEAVLGCADFTLSGIVEHFDMSSLCLEMFADANLAGSETSARSTSGGVVFVVSPSGQTRFPLGWLCQRQTSTSTSTAESEVVSLSKVTSSLLLPLESTWDQLVSRSIKVYGREDNMACIAIVKSGRSTSLRFIAKH